MSKFIKVTPALIEEIKDDFFAALANARMSDGKFNFTHSFETVERKAELQFTEMAWLKMMTLVYNSDKEIAWHGVVKKEDEDVYVVSDILVYPQKVTGSTVESDDDAYPLWYAKLTDNPEVFENLRMQGHSHVNMGVSPSPTDLEFYREILTHVGENDFYVFVIVNKKTEMTVKIYDFEKNCLFDTADVSVSIIDNGANMTEFLKEAKEMVKTYTPAVKATPKPVQSYKPGGYYGSSWYGGGNYYGNGSKSDKKSSKYDAPFSTRWDYDDF